MGMGFFGGARAPHRACQATLGRSSAWCPVAAPAHSSRVARAGRRVSVSDRCAVRVAHRWGVGSPQWYVMSVALESAQRYPPAPFLDPLTLVTLWARYLGCRVVILKSKGKMYLIKGTSPIEYSVVQRQHSANHSTKKKGPGPTSG